ncbi:hypothetical protein H312_03432 [Anncaliia algerae PRA339]|uniref:Transposase Tc1-like domain-containing protein n=1 Tax=Anncaliia algerae PRA339 TaxID=1288291 RepID=A0A059EVY2_9MICR|nr:hypothetical protein H312_03432 [Anncaliia algerae PRA339]
MDVLLTFLKNCPKLYWKKSNSRISLRKIEEALKKEQEILLSHTSIKRYLDKIDLFSFSPISKPFLTSYHFKTRFEASKY